LIADAHVAPDVRKLREFLYVSFRKLCRRAGVKTARKAWPRMQNSTPAEPVPLTVAEPATQPPADTAPLMEVGVKAVA